MKHNNIEVQLIHHRAMEKDNSFGFRVLIDNEEKSILELEKLDMLHIGAILLNAGKTFIDKANKIK